MATPRELIAAKIKADNPSLDVFDFGSKLSELRRETVTVFREQIAQGPSGTLVHLLTVRAYSLASDPTKKAEASLDTLLDKVLLSLRRLDTVEFKTADRRVLDDVFQGWEIAVSWTSHDYYKTTVTTGG